MGIWYTEKVLFACDFRDCERISDLVRELVVIEQWNQEGTTIRFDMTSIKMSARNKNSTPATKELHAWCVHAKELVPSASIICCIDWDDFDTDTVFHDWDERVHGKPILF